MATERLGLTMLKKIFLLFLISSSLAFAADEKFRDNREFFKDVAGELRCPTCTGLSVLDSDATFSVQIKDQVDEQIKEGKSKDEILSFFVDRYGPWILREPPKSGFNLMAWATPIALLLAGPILIWMFFLRKDESLEAHVRSSEEILAQMDSDLKALRGTK